MADLATLVAAALFLLFAVHRHRVVRRRPTPHDMTQRHIASFAWCLGTAMLVDTPAVASALPVTARGDSLLFLVVHLLKTAAFGYVSLIAVTLVHPVPPVRTVRRHRALLAGALAVSVVLHLVGRVTVTADSVEVGDGRGWALAAFDGVFVLYGVWAQTLLGAALLTHARSAAPGALRTGLRLMIVAVASGVAWTLWAVHDVAISLTSGRLGAEEDTVSVTLGALTALLATAAATTAFWSGPTGTPLRWLRTQRRLRALRPLWSALHEQLPHIALGSPTAGRVPLRDGEFALYRTVIEIRDGYLSLRPYMPPVPPEATGTGGTRAVREAAMIREALRNLRANRPIVPGGALPTTVHEPAAPATGEVGAALAAETAWLTQVSRAFAAQREGPRVTAGHGSRA
ncbi:MAB_1171c family putative transporter [Streptomyces sp. NPDC005840]|uniref:MAB_1171c family putative transporter n=1 Tax=Streptomyces sp. NPDC005840 TaxID=3157072 RepID=UPI003403EBC3